MSLKIISYSKMMETLWQNKTHFPPDLWCVCMLTQFLGLMSWIMHTLQSYGETITKKQRFPMLFENIHFAVWVNSAPATITSFLKYIQPSVEFQEISELIVTLCNIQFAKVSLVVVQQNDLAGFNCKV